MYNRAFEHVPNGIDHAKCLDGAFRLLDEFAALVKSEIRTTTSNDPLLLGRDTHNEYGHARISSTADEESLQRMRQGVTNLQTAGLYGSAFLLQMDQMMKYPTQIDDADKQRFEEARGQFLSVWHSPPIYHEIGQNAPKELQLMSLALPHLPNGSFGYNPTMVDLFLQDRLSSLEPAIRHDCLGRTPSHIRIDAGIHNTRWSDAHVNHKDILGRTALYFACRDGNEKQVKELLEADVDIYAQTFTGLSPLHVAAYMGYTSICRWIWQKHRDKGTAENGWKAADCTGRTPLLCAASTGQHEAIEFFCNIRPHISVADHVDCYWNSALGLAVRGGHLNAVRILLKYGFSADIPDKLHRTPFWYAVQGSDYRIMEVLGLGKVASPDHKDINGRTPLAEAARNGNIEAVQFLLSLNDQDPLGSMKGSRISWKVDPNSKDRDGKSPLILATEAGRTDCVVAFLAQDCAFHHEDYAHVCSIVNARQDFEMGKAIKKFSLNSKWKKKKSSELTWII
ncbi:ankyrin [Trematosphaeria pertusa]|uniref:Ankyrin n=1 Tax=Trematosphaeria pertusa TaxID=390896 RepID=A0A6A6I623_9PLEO|nr:ankyrin [Trematosphaeria pertusa]KAF2245679.1 ankyrin [Trematosphaeria pertusa]